MSVQEEIEQSMPHINHWNMPQFVQTVRRKELRLILLHHDNIMRWGRLCDAKSKHIGAGIYKLWYEERILREETS